MYPLLCIRRLLPKALPQAKHSHFLGRLSLVWTTLLVKTMATTNANRTTKHMAKPDTRSWTALSRHSRTHLHLLQLPHLLLLPDLLGELLDPLLLSRIFLLCDPDPLRVLESRRVPCLLEQESERHGDCLFLVNVLCLDACGEKGDGTGSQGAPSLRRRLGVPSPRGVNIVVRFGPSRNRQKKNGNGVRDSVARSSAATTCWATTSGKRGRYCRGVETSTALNHPLPLLLRH